MKFPTKLLLISGVLISLFSGCKKGGGTTPPVPDTTKPTISVINPSAGQSFTAGSTIPFQVTFADNTGLKNYDVSISKVPAGGLILKNVPTSVPFSYLKSSTSFSTGVKQQDITITDIAIAANTTSTIVTPGNYNLTINCSDTSDNNASTILVISIN